MKRINITPRQNWSTQIEALGFDFYHINGIPYWHESAYYEFSAAEIDEFEAAANAVHQLCLRAVERIISERLYPLLGIDIDVGKLIAKSWEKREPAIYGRFDFLYDGSGPPKLLEYNADTPSSLFEASIVQWQWREQVFPNADQFNSIEESLTERWRSMLIGQWVDDGRGNNIADQLYVTTAAPHPEDEHTVQYMGSIAEKAGFKVEFIPIQEIGWNGRDFTTRAEVAMRQIFKLYPWEWLMADPFGENIAAQMRGETGTTSTWLEPIWKMLLSNKGILPILWEMFPEHENLLPAYRDPSAFGNAAYVAKPNLGREGSNITIYDATGKVIQKTEGSYGNDGPLPGHGTYVYQGLGESAAFDGIRPNLGVWMANDRACGMGIREDDTLVVANGSRFVPHIFT